MGDLSFFYIVVGSSKTLHFQNIYLKINNLCLPQQKIIPCFIPTFMNFFMLQVYLKARCNSLFTKLFNEKHLNFFLFQQNFPTLQK